MHACFELPPLHVSHHHLWVPPPTVLYCTFRDTGAEPGASRSTSWASTPADSAAAFGVWRVGVANPVGADGVDGGTGATTVQSATTDQELSSFLSLQPPCPPPRARPAAWNSSSRTAVGDVQLVAVLGHRLQVLADGIHGAWDDALAAAAMRASLQAVGMPCAMCVWANVRARQRVALKVSSAVTCVRLYPCADASCPCHG